MTDHAESSSAGAKKALKANVNGAQSDYELPWVEKYRPVYLDDVVGNSETIERLKIIAKDGNMPYVDSRKIAMLAPEDFCGRNDLDPPTTS